MNRLQRSFFKMTVMPHKLKPPTWMHFLNHLTACEWATDYLNIRSPAWSSNLSQIEATIYFSSYMWLKFVEIVLLLGHGLSMESKWLKMDLKASEGLKDCFPARPVASLPLLTPLCVPFRSFEVPGYIVVYLMQVRKITKKNIKKKCYSLKSYFVYVR